MHDVGPLVGGVQVADQVGELVGAVHEGLQRLPRTPVQVLVTGRHLDRLDAAVLLRVVPVRVHQHVLRPVQFVDQVLDRVGQVVGTHDLGFRQVAGHVGPDVEVSTHPVVPDRVGTGALAFFEQAYRHV